MAQTGTWGTSLPPGSDLLYLQTKLHQEIPTGTWMLSGLFPGNLIVFPSAFHPPQGCMFLIHDMSPAFIFATFVI